MKKGKIFELICGLFIPVAIAAYGAYSDYKGQKETEAELDSLRDRVKQLESK